MKNLVFVDTSAWYSLIVPTDPDHAQSLSLIKNELLQFVTTDYIVDEILTLLRARGERTRAIENR